MHAVIFGQIILLRYINVDSSACHKYPEGLVAVKYLYTSVPDGQIVDSKPVVDPVGSS